MNGLEVLQALEAGKKVRQTSWDSKIYVFMDENKTVRYYDTGRYNMSVQELYTKNWEIYTPPLTYIEALTQLEPGQKVRVISGGNGAHGVNGKIGTIVIENSLNGVSNTFLKFKPHNSQDWVWGLAKDCLVERV